MFTDNVARGVRRRGIILGFACVSGFKKIIGQCKVGVLGDVNAKVGDVVGEKRGLEVCRSSGNDSGGWEKLAQEGRYSQVYVGYGGP